MSDYDDGFYGPDPDLVSLERFFTTEEAEYGASVLEAKAGAESEALAKAAAELAAVRANAKANRRTFNNQLASHRPQNKRKRV
jgi:hypothetical protein